MERPRAQQIKDRFAANVAAQQFRVVVSRATGVFCGFVGTTICGTGVGKGGGAERALRGSAPQLKDLWVARAVELAQRQCAITHALIKLSPNGKPVRMGATGVTHALTKRVQ